MDVLCQILACQAPAPAQQGAQFSAARRRSIARWAPTPQQAATSEESVSLPPVPTRWPPPGKIKWFAKLPALSTVGPINSPAAVAPWMAAILAGQSERLILSSILSNFLRSVDEHHL